MNEIRRIADLEATVHAAVKRLRSAADVVWTEVGDSFAVQELGAAADLLEDCLGRTA